MVISLYQPITTNYTIVNLIDLKWLSLVCIEAAMLNGGQALRSMMWYENGTRSRLIVDI